MENYDRYYDQQSSQDYDQYNLWQNSRFHNGFHLHTQWGEDSSPSQELDSSSDDEKSGDEGKKSPDQKSRLEGQKRPEINAKRIVTRAELLADPEPYCNMVFGSKEEKVGPQEFLREDKQEVNSLQNPRNPSEQSSSNDWTHTHWRKANTELPEISSHTTAAPGNSNLSKQGTQNIANCRVKASNLVETEMSTLATEPEAGEEMDYQVNNVQRRIMKAVSQPIAISKATYMMERMGWKGGPLGLRSDGIAEPIAPNATYITKKGFGHKEPIPEKRMPKKRDPPPNKKAKLTRKENRAVQKGKQNKSRKTREELITTNSLIEILGFVSNDRELEISFDKKLTGIERKIIHNTVQFIADGIQEMETINYDNVHHMKLLERIEECNHYSLVTLSDGERKERQLSLYKEARDHTYLVTPDHLLPDEEATDVVNNPDTCDNKTDGSIIDLCDSNENSDENIDEESIVEENSNPFLKSIERSLKNDIAMKTDIESAQIKENSKLNTENSVCSKTVHNSVKDNKFDSEMNEKNKDLTEILKEYFMEFLDEDMYTEFRFLGPFSDRETKKINAFINNIYYCVYTGESCEDYAVILGKINSEESYYYEVKKDCNGSVVIYKCKTEDINT